MHQKGIGSYRAFLWVLVVPGVIIVLTTLYSFRISEAISAEYTPLVNASMALEIEVSHAHLSFEEALYGDDGSTMEEVAARLEEANRHVSAMLVGGRGPLDDAIIPLTDPFLRSRIAEIRTELSILRRMMKERIAQSTQPGDHLPLDARFDQLIESVMIETDGVKSQMQQRLNRERSWQKLTQMLTLSLTILLLTAMIIAFRRFENREREIRQELETLATRDSLTGVLNRRSFDLLIEDEWQHATRARTPLSLILCDVDQFKRYNDSLGHQEGDSCLKGVAEILQSGLLRPIDRLARYGGEEFAIVLPFCDREGASQVMDRIHHLLEEEAFPHPASEVADRVTVSAGIATLPPNGRCVSVAEMVRVADRELYRAKQDGRNQTYAADVLV